MNKLLALICLLSITSTSVAFADECPKNANDPFGIQATMSDGPFKGHCINTDKYRSARRLTQDERKSFFTPSEIARLANEGIDAFDSKLEVMANFAHAGALAPEHFYVAVIPLERIDSAIIQITPLSKIAPVNHGQIRLALTKTGRPVKLIDQSNSSTRAMLTLDDDIIITISGVHPIDNEGSYSALKGLRNGYYGEEYQIGSMQDLTINWIVSAKLHTKEYKLNVSTEQARTALTSGLDIATKNGVTAPYSTLSSSCVTYAFAILHISLGTSDDGTLRKDLQSVTPYIALGYLNLINNDGSSYIDQLPK